MLTKTADEPLYLPHRYAELDSLRGIAALTVVLGHFLNVWKTESWWADFNASPLRVIAAGHEAVLLFFLLSGFVLAIPFRKSQPPRYPEFFVRRFCRIYLPYAAAVVLAAVADQVFYSMTPTGNPWIDQTWNQPPTRRLILQHFLMIGHFDNFQLNTAFWSLVYEMRISIIYPLLYWLSRKISAPLLLSGAFMVTIVAALCEDRLGSEGFFYDFLYGSFFVVGIILQNNVVQLGDWLRARTATERAAVVVVALLCFDGPGALPSWRLLGSSLLPLYLADWTSLFGAVLILLCAINLPFVRRFLHRPFVLRLGLISYSVYLVHATVLFVLIRLSVGGRYFAWLFPVYLLVTYALAEVFHALFERPSTLLGRKIGSLMHRQQGGGAAGSRRRVAGPIAL